MSFCLSEVRKNVKRKRGRSLIHLTWKLEICKYTLTAIWFNGFIVWHHKLYHMWLSFTSGPKHLQPCSSNTMSSWDHPITSLWIQTSSTSPSRTNWIWSPPWWTVCMPSVSRLFSLYFCYYLFCFIWIMQQCGGRWHWYIHCELTFSFYYFVI